MADAHIHLDPAQALAAQPGKGHNRWHPDIAPAVRVATGSTVELGTIDGLDGQITPATEAADLLRVDMGRVHPLTGPVHVEGAEPGDLLAVRIEAIETAPRGFSTTPRCRDGSGNPGTARAECPVAPGLGQRR